MTSAQSFYRSIIHAPDPLAVLNGYPHSEPPTFETEWLDFKGQPKDDDNARQIWSKVLSGFGNTGGGVIVWGIDARKVNGVDAASGLRLIENPMAFRSKLTQWLPPITDPPVSGVEIIAYPDPNADNAGFVVCHIPEQPDKPIRAEVSDKGCQYYFRVADSFHVPNRALLRTMFFPHSRARLKVEITAAYEASRCVAHFEAILTNEGEASAHDLLAGVKFESTYAFLKFAGADDWKIENIASGNGIALPRPMHPGFRTRMFYTYFNTTLTPDERGVKFSIVVYCHDQRPYTWEISFSLEDILASKTKIARAVDVVETGFANPRVEIKTIS